MALTAWSPLAGGLLTGKFNRDADPEASADARLNKASYGPAMLAEKRIRIAEGLSELARTIGCAAVAAGAGLADAPACAERVIPILGARTFEQFEANLACLDIELNRTQVEELDNLNVPPPVYPASLFASDFYQQMMHGQHKVGR